MIGSEKCYFEYIEVGKIKTPSYLPQVQLVVKAWKKLRKRL